MYKYTLKYERLIDIPKHIINVNNIPENIDLRDKFPLCFNQGEIASCTANAIVAVYAYYDANFMGSRMFLYYNERQADNDIEDDKGSTLSQGIHVAENIGICSEEEWKYDIKLFDIRPPEKCYLEAKNHKANDYYHIEQTENAIKATLAKGYPILLGITVYESFENEEVAKNGIVSLPLPNENLLGHHAVVLVGYNNNNQWILRNSWGTEWGDNGYFYLPFDYLTDQYLATDLWVLTLSLSPRNS